jgi:uncharacterized protein YjiS (DUF1127 family)
MRPWREMAAYTAEENSPMSSCIDDLDRELAARPAAPRLSLRPLLDRLFVWITLARSRRDLAALDDRALRDIGLDRATAAEEASKPFWRSG